MVIGVGRITFKLSLCHSLKEKRKVVKAIIHRTQKTFNVSMAEVDLNDTHQRAEIGFSLVGNDRRRINSKIDKLFEFAENLQLAEIIDTDMEIINIELKNHLSYPNLETKVLKLVDEFKIRDKVIISSFNHYSLEKIKKIQPAIKTGALLMAKIINPADYAFKRGFDALHMQFLTIDQTTIEKAHFMGMKICAYTVNYSESAIDLLEKGSGNLTSSLFTVKEGLNFGNTSFN
jgi:uncharacterized protein YlxP (DUF503 family)